MLNQNKQWAIGLLVVGFSKYNPTINLRLTGHGTSDGLTSARWILGHMVHSNYYICLYLLLALFNRGVIGSVRSVFLVLANRNRNFRFVKFPTEIDRNNWKPIGFGCISVLVGFSRFSVSVNITNSQSQKEKNNSTSHGIIDFSIRK